MNSSSLRLYSLNATGVNRGEGDGQLPTRRCPGRPVQPPERSCSPETSGKGKINGEPLWLALRQQALHVSRPPQAAPTSPAVEHQVFRIFEPRRPTTPPVLQKGKARLTVPVSLGRVQRPAVQTKGASSQFGIHECLSAMLTCQWPDNPVHNQPHFPGWLQA